MIKLVTKLYKFHLMYLMILSATYLLLSYFLMPWFGGTDLYSFKDPGVNLATGQGFIAENLPNMPQGIRTLYLEYTPLYPFLFGVWSWIVGIGLKQATVFNAIIDILRTVILFAVARRILQYYVVSNTGTYISGELKIAYVIAAVLSGLTILLRTGYGDRPDDLAVSFQMLVLYILAPRVGRDCNYKESCPPSVKNAIGKRESFLSGVCAGLVFLTSPAIGIYTVILAGTLLISYTWGCSKVVCLVSGIKAFVSSASGFLGTVFPVAVTYLIIDPVSVLRFRRAASHRIDQQGFWSIFQGDFSIYTEHLSWAWRVGHSYILFAIVMILALTSLVLLRGNRKQPDQLHRFVSAVVIALLTSTVVHFVTFPPQFVYLWSMAFVSVALIIPYVSYMACFSGLRKTAAVLLLCMTLGVSGVYSVAGLFWIEAIQRPSSQKPGINRTELLKAIPKGSRVLTTPVHYWLLRQDYQIAGPDNVTNWADYDYLVVPSNGTGVLGKPYVPVPAGKNDFEKSWTMVKNTLNTKPLSIFGVRISNSGWGYGFALYRKVNN